MSKFYIYFFISDNIVTYHFLLFVKILEKSLGTSNLTISFLEDLKLNSCATRKSRVYL